MAGLRQVHGSRAGNTFRPVLTAAVLAVLAGAPAVAWTQTAPASEAAPGLQEIVVTATRHEESLSKVPLSVTALTQENLDIRGIKDFQDVAKFTPGVNIDNSGTNNISIRGIASTGGAGTTGIYIDDTPIQMRALAFNPDEALPKSFDIDRVEVLRGPQGTLFGAGSEGGTVRYITTQPSLTKTSVYGRAELSYTQGGAPSYEAGVAAGGPIVDGTFGARASVWYRKDGGWIDRVDPTAANPLAAVLDKNANHDETVLVRLAAIWAPSDRWTLTPSFYYQDRQRNDVENYWPIYSNPGSDRYVSANPTQRSAPDNFYLPALKIEGDFGAARLISNTSYYHRKNTTGYDGTLYNLGFYQSLLGLSGSSLLVDGNGVHLPPDVPGLPSVINYRAPASVQNIQQNFTQEIRLQSTDPNAKLVWTTGLFFSENRQHYLEQIYDPLAENFFQRLAGSSVADFFAYCAVVPNPDGSCPQALTPSPLLSNGDSYILSTQAKDTQFAWFGEATYSFTDTLKATVGARVSKTKFTFDSYTAGPQLYAAPQVASPGNSETFFTPKVGLEYQMDSHNLFYVTYAKGFRPGGGNNPIPEAACAQDAQNMGLTNGFPGSFDSDTVQSYEIGAKNNFSNRVKLASSVYYIKWNNIQQTVIPPICQISFITNLGQAEAKGVDFQAEFAVTGSFTAEIAAGYTDARYTKDSLLPAAPGAPPVMPLVAKGDAIVGQSGQPGAPFTASVGLEYRFSAFDHESFVRADYSYEGRAKWLGAGQDPNTLQFDPANYTVDATNFVTLRAGTTFGGWQVAAFIDNLTDTHTVTNYNFTIDPGTGDSRLERQFTFRPRTFGVNFTYRH
jgi:iron complex outermembrane receptor protein